MHLVNNIQPLQTFNGSITKAIQSLPPELQEKIYKKYLTLKIRERLDLGFHEIHHEIFHAPFCHKCEQITKITTCKICTSCWLEDLCIHCYRNGEFTHLDPPEDVSWEYYSDIKWRVDV